MKEYDPNRHFGEHTVELTFQQWEFKLKRQVKVKGNCKGLTIIESAILNLADEWYEEQGRDITLSLFDDQGNELETTFEVDAIEEELQDILVKAEILGFINE